MQFKWRYIDDIEADDNTDNLYGIFGTSFHKVMELIDRYNLPEEDAKKFWRPIFYNWMSEAKKLDKSADYEKFINKGAQVIENGLELRKRWKETTKLISTEQKVKLEYKNKIIKNTIISAKLDLIVKDKKEEVFTVIDWKTSSRKEKNIDENVQMSTYIWIVYETYIKDYDSIHGALVYPKLNKILFTTRNEDQIRVFFSKVDLMLERVKANDWKKEPKLAKDRNRCMFCQYIFSCGKRKI